MNRSVRLSFLLMTLLVVPSVLAREKSCPKQFASLVAKTPYHAAKALYFPVIEPIDLSVRIGTYLRKQGREGVLSHLGDRLRKDAAYIPSFMGFVFFGALTNQTISDFDKATQEFDDRTSQVTVVADCTPAGDVLKIIGTGAQRAKRYPGVHVIGCSSSEEFLLGLEEISRTYGRIGRLEVVVHGSPGSTAMTGKSFWDWAKELSDKGYIEEGGRRIYPNGIFEKDAHVRFISCAFGSGMKGQLELEGFAQALLLPNGGGTIFSSRTTLASSATDAVTGFMGWKQPPQVVRDYDAPLVYTTLTAHSLWQSLGGSWESQNNFYPLTDHAFVLSPARRSRYSARFSELRKALHASTRADHQIALFDSEERKLKTEEERLEFQALKEAYSFGVR